MITVVLGWTQATLWLYDLLSVVPMGCRGTACSSIGLSWSAGSLAPCLEHLLISFCTDLGGCRDVFFPSLSPLSQNLSMEVQNSLQLRGHSHYWGLLQLGAYLKGNTLLHAETKEPKTKSTSKGTLPSPQIISTVNTVTQRMQECKILIFGNKINYYIFMGNWQMAISHLELGNIYFLFL